MLDHLFSTTGLLAVAFGYLLGSIPFGLILTRAAGLGDVRKIGSGNIGATNVLRTGNKALAAATLVLDALKATIAVLVVHGLIQGAGGFKMPYVPGVAMDVTQSAAAWRAFSISALAGAAAVVGHIFPVWLGFKGGKGVATVIGALLGIYWPLAVFFCGSWLILAVAFRYSSAAALGAGVVTAVYPFLFGEVALGALTLAMVALMIAKHAPNIRRLIAGEEPKIGAKTTGKP
jgi:glycerol-3-phosphate acyltransferase PlsY